jgi:hypothetical protein
MVPFKEKLVFEEFVSLNDIEKLNLINDMTLKQKQNFN